MANNLLEQLADWEVPPPPAAFDTQLHDRVNRSLLTAQLVDLLVSGVPWALLQFGKAFLGLLTFTACGRYETKEKKNRRG
jgi:hypothetical protein